MVEAVMLWNEPNNLSHWDFKVDPDWKMFARMIIAAAKEVRKVNPALTIALGGMSPVDPNFVKLLGSYGVLATSESSNTGSAGKAWESSSRSG